MTLPLLIDDFSTGPWNTTITTPGAGDADFEPGSAILGGARYTSIRNVTDPHDTPVTLALGAGNGLNITVGLGQQAGIDLGYGWAPGGADAPLGLNLIEPGAGAFRASFDGAAGPWLGCTLLVLFEGGSTIWSTPASTSATAFTIDYPFEKLSATARSDFQRVNYVLFTFSTQDDLAIASLEII